MAVCSGCGAETELHQNSVPICPSCSGARETIPGPWSSHDPIREALIHKVLETTARKTEALRNFDAVMLHFPTRLPHAGGVKQIENASTELSIARKEMEQAHDRLNTYLETGMVPEDGNPEE